MEEISKSKINFELLKHVYKGMAPFYIDTINYNSSNDVKSVLNNKYYNYKKFYRQMVFNLTGSYFENDKAKIIFNKIIKHCYSKRIKDPNIPLEECIRDWKKNYLKKYDEMYGRQNIDDDYRLLNRIKKHFTCRLSA